MDKFTFDGTNKLFIVKSGVTDIDVKIDLYSDWKEELFLSDNLKFEQALTTDGGVPTQGTDKTGFSCFLINGWKIKPAEENSTVEFTNGNLFTDDASSPFVFSDGAYNTNWILNRSNLRDEVDSTSSAGFVTALRETRFLAPSEGGSGVRFDDIMLFLLGMANGRIEEVSDGVYRFYAQDDTTELFTLTKSTSERNRAYGTGLPQ